MYSKKMKNLIIMNTLH